MNACLRALEAIFSAAMIPLIQATVVLLAASIIHQTIRRSAATLRSPRRNITDRVNAQ